MMNNRIYTADKPFVMVIFGASGDLTKRKLMPALYSLFKDNRLPKEFSILGVGRTVYSDSQYRSYILDEIKKFIKEEDQNETWIDAFISHLYYLSIDPAIESEYGLLSCRLKNWEVKSVQIMFCFTWLLLLLYMV